MWLKRLWRVCLAAGFLFSVSVVASPFVPDALVPWQQWVLDKHDELDCPLAEPAAPMAKRSTGAVSRSCVWPAYLSLDVDANRARFEMEAVLLREDWLLLPGEKAYWPMDVRVNGKTRPIAERNGSPALFLPAGEYRVTGNLQWQQLPPSLQLPADTGLLSLRLQGEPQPWLNRDAAGRLWFVEQGVAGNNKKQHDSLDVDVFRKLVEAVPMRIETRVRLTVSGADRELQLGRFLPEHTVVEAFRSNLPARIEADGRLRIQARAGVWWVTLVSRLETPQNSFRAEALDAQWPAEEVWVYEADRRLRSVSLSGAVSIDPSRIDLPSEWQSLPAYLMTQESRLLLAEESRGDVAPAENSLQLTRSLWMDFDGRGLTVRDDLSGQMNQGWRLSMLPGYDLGRAELNGEPQLVTTLAGETRPGLELREGQLQLMTVSRFETPDALFSVGPLGATGWQHPVSSLQASLHLPPGWRFLHAQGVDRAYGSWWEAWDLLDIFLLAIITVAFSRLLGVRWGVLAFVTLVLLFHERHAPIFTWLLLAILLGLLKLVPENAFRRALTMLLYATITAMVVMVLQFSIDQLRRGIYPQLEHAGSITEHYSARSPASAVVEKKAKEAESLMRTMKVEQSMMALEEADVAPQRLKKGYDPDARIQTGPGEPLWQWNRFTLSWSGPVSASQSLTLYLLPPAASRFLHFLRVLLLVALAGGVLLLAFRQYLPVAQGRRPAAGAGTGVGTESGTALSLLLALPLAFLLATHSASVKADFPPAEILSDLEQRLTAPPECLPDCVLLESGQISIEGDNLRLDLNVHAQAFATFVLPAQLNQWLPDAVLVDDSKPASLRQAAGGQLALALEPGVHRVVLKGRIQHEQFQLPFAASAYNLTVLADGWQVRGLVEGRVPGGHLQFVREQKQQPGDAQGSKLIPDPVVPFVLVERRLVLDLKWSVVTTVTRIAPAEGSLAVRVPVLPGESVITRGIKIDDGYVDMVLGERRNRFVWESQLEPVSELTLLAANDASFVEAWQLEPSTLWHVQTQGLLPVKPRAGEASSFSRWRPLPGESLNIRIERPLAVEGPTVTVDNVILDYRPGKRTAEAILQLEIRSSQGGDYRLALPENALVQSLEIDGQEQNTPSDSREVILPLHPGVQQARLRWMQEEGIATRTFTPAVSLQSSPYNIALKMQVPQDRWTLLVGGPDIGPAMLYWGVLLVIVLLAFVLGRFRQVPVSTWQWLLLGIGMSTVTAIGSVFVVFWFFILSKRRSLAEKLGDTAFNMLQLGIVLLTIVALASLLATIPLSLLSSPNMQVTGNGSSAYQLVWYQDRFQQALPQGWLLSLPMGVYRLAMLLWSLWLVYALMGWLRWGWSCFSEAGLWRKPGKVKSVDDGRLSVSVKSVEADNRKDQE